MPTAKAITFLSLAICCAAPFAAVAQSYPSHPIKIIVPYPPGGNTDIVGRLFAERLDKSLGVSLVVDNRGGAGGAVGVEAAVRSDPDGYTLLHATNSELTVIPAVRRSSYNPTEDLVAISTTSMFPFVLVTRKDLHVQTVQELVASAARNAGQVKFASVGTGTANHLIIEPFKARFKIDAIHVPYKGAAQALTDLLGGHVDASFATVSSVLPQLRSGDLRALFVTSKQRMPQLADVPSAGELGFDELQVNNWTGFFAPARTPREIITTLHNAIVEAGKDTSVIEAIRKAGAEAVVSTSSSANELLVTDLARWRRIANEMAIKIE